MRTLTVKATWTLLPWRLEPGYLTRRWVCGSVDTEAARVRFSEVDGKWEFMCWGVALDDPAPVAEGQHADLTKVLIQVESSLAAWVGEQQEAETDAA